MMCKSLDVNSSIVVGACWIVERLFVSIFDLHRLILPAAELLHMRRVFTQKKHIQKWKKMTKSFRGCLDRCRALEPDFHEAVLSTITVQSYAGCHVFRLFAGLNVLAPCMKSNCGIKIVIPRHGLPMQDGTQVRSSINEKVFSNIGCYLLCNLHGTHTQYSIERRGYCHFVCCVEGGYAYIRFRKRWKTFQSALQSRDRDPLTTVVCFGSPSGESFQCGL